MNLGQIFRLWGAVHYQPDLKFYDHMFAAAKNRLGEDFKHWRTDRLSVVMYNTDTHALLNIGHKNLGFECANPDKAADSLRHLASHARSAMTDLRITALTRMGIKLVVYCDLELSFEEMTKRLRPLCLPSNQDLERLTSPDVLDLAIRYDYAREESTCQVRVGPMRKEQGMQMLEGVGSYTELFPAPTKTQDLSAFCNLVPDTFLYVDLDVFSTAATTPDAWSSFAQKTYDHIQSVFLGLTAIVKGVS